MSAPAAVSAPAALERAALPVLALGGGRDVPPDLVRAWGAHLPPGSRIEILPDVTHILTRLAFDGDDLRSPAEVATQVDAAVLDAIITWLDEMRARCDHHTQPTRPPYQGTRRSCDRSVTHRGCNG